MKRPNWRVCPSTKYHPPLQPDGRKSTEKTRTLSEEALRDGCGTFEWVHRDLTGKEFWVEVFLTVISERAPMVTFGTWRDITERKRSEKELRESYERLRMLSAHIQEVREYERKSVARELHDVLGQMLTTINMDLAWMKNKDTGKREGCPWQDHGGYFPGQTGGQDGPEGIVGAAPRHSRGFRAHTGHRTGRPVLPSPDGDYHGGKIGPCGGS